MEMRKEAFYALFWYLPFLAAYMSLAVRYTGFPKLDSNYTNNCTATYGLIGGWQCDSRGTAMLEYVETNDVFYYSARVNSQVVIDGGIRLFPANYGWIVIYIYIFGYALRYRCFTINTLSMIIGFGCRIAWLSSPRNAYYNQLLIYVDSFGIIIAVFDLIRHFRFLHGLRTIRDSLAYGLVDGIIVILMIANLYFAFAIGFNVVFGSTLYGFSNYAFSLQQILTMSFGNYAWQYPASERREIAYVLWPSLAVIAVVILQNVFIAIFSRAFSAASDETFMERLLETHSESVFKSVRTYIRLYRNQLVGDGKYHISAELQETLARTIGNECASKYLNSEDDISIVIRDMAEQYEFALAENKGPTYRDYVYANFHDKFRRTQMACVADAAFAPLYIAVYVASVYFAYEICNVDVEIWISNSLRGLAFAPPPFADGSIRTITDVPCQPYGVNGWYDVKNGRINMYSVQSRESFIYMAFVICIYGIASFVRRNVYMVVVTCMTGCHYIIRSVMANVNACYALELSQADKAISAIIIVLESFGIFLIFSTNRRVRFFFAICKYSIVQMRSILGIVIMTIIAFGSSNYVLFGYYNYSDSGAAAFNVIAGGNVNFQNDYDRQPYLAMVWYISLVMVGTLILYNMVIAIITDAYARAASKIYDVEPAKMAMKVYARLPLEFVPYYNYFYWKILNRTLLCEPFTRHTIADTDYAQFLTSEFGTHVNDVYSDLIRPLSTIYGGGERIEKELWLRALEIKHVISTKKNTN
jgi:hypothetical protein